MKSTYVCKRQILTNTFEKIRRTAEIYDSADVVAVITMADVSHLTAMSP